MPILIILILLILNFFLKDNFLINKSLVLLILISISYFSYKNISRLYNDYYVANYSLVNSWPLHLEMLPNEDYISTQIFNFKINLRLPTNKLFMGNLDQKNNYILHCGNIKMPCTPIKKIKCIKNIENIYGYLFFYNNENECLKLYSENSLY